MITSQNLIETLFQISQETERSNASIPFHFTVKYLDFAIHSFIRSLLHIMIYISFVFKNCGGKNVFFIYWQMSLHVAKHDSKYFELPECLAKKLSKFKFCLDKLFYCVFNIHLGLLYS